MSDMADAVDAGSGAPSRPVRLVDVAAEAGVSPSTVSRAFKNPDRVNPATVTQIRQAADRLGYVYRPYRKRPMRNSGIISLVVKDAAASSALLRGAQNEAYASGLAISVIESNRGGQWEVSFVEEVAETSRGILIASDRMDDERLAHLARRVPLVVLNRPVDGVSSIVPDACSGAAQAVSLLASNRHAAVVYVSGPESWADRSRLHAVRAAARSLGLTVRRIGPVDSSAQGGEQAARMMLDHGIGRHDGWSAGHSVDGLRDDGSMPTAVIAYNDTIAAGMTAWLEQAGVRVPDDLSVIAFDDSPIAAVVRPQLTAITIPRAQIGAVGVRALLRMSESGLYALNTFGADDMATLRLPEGHATIGGNVLALPTALLVRGSVGPASSPR
ncbi:LacI family DNA-binding transcriptional regulator [Bifidobacterium sp. 82T24]|uniref:LacI family DNA-binding transcriptional regulator n=1 Tax=Bifidobacterium pluvialisilvae TaxID=2834436 RepID=UPI001C5843FA|nr:LacI family DNA-binding transcriptional regulator [Bifidobacterium pluvialisilvae]MBW3088274.1 LacI family DNA-binding transcriptional regulator [Bifidobacterium pluvialisilvae]